jgi:hypothetical protein
MLKGVIVGPDYELATQLEQALFEVGHVGVVRKIESYPTPVELFRILRAHAPDLIFVNTDVLSLALDLVGQIEKNFQGLQVVAFNRKCEQHSLLEVMRAGVRETTSRYHKPVRKKGISGSENYKRNKGLHCRLRRDAGRGGARVLQCAIDRAGDGH